MRPHVEAMEAKYKDQVAFWRIDTDNLASRRLVRDYEVTAIPLVVLLDQSGKVVLTLEGYRDEAELDEAIQYLLSKSGKLTGTPPAPTAPRNSA
jgi:thioredoxin-related protein